MVLLAQRILRAPRLLILDEPTSALDLHHQLLVLRHLKTYAQTRQAVIVLALHDLSLAARFCDELIMLKDGREVISGPTADVLSKQSIDDCWTVSVELLHARDGYKVIVPHERVS